MGKPLRIVSSCGEPWDAMSPRTGGRHCGRCDRVVVDVRGLGRAEAVAKLAAVKKERGDVCGRATVNAETHELVFARAPSAPRVRLPWRGVLLAAALASGCEHALNAAPPQPTAVLAPLPPPPPAPGQLLDAQDGGVEPDAGTPDGSAPDAGRRRHRRRRPPRTIVLDEVGYMSGDF